MVYSVTFIGFDLVFNNLIMDNADNLLSLRFTENNHTFTCNNCIFSFNQNSVISVPIFSPIINGTFNNCTFESIKMENSVPFMIIKQSLDINDCIFEDILSNNFISINKSLTNNFIPNSYYDVTINIDGSNFVSTNIFNIINEKIVSSLSCVVDTYITIMNCYIEGEYISITMVDNILNTVIIVFNITIFNTYAIAMNDLSYHSNAIAPVIKIGSNTDAIIQNSQFYTNACRNALGLLELRQSINWYDILIDL